MSTNIESLGLTMDDNNIITTAPSKYRGFKVVDKPFEPGDFVIPIGTSEMAKKYRITLQSKNWIGLVWNLLDIDQGRIYLVDAYNSYNVDVHEMVVVEPTEAAILAFIDTFVSPKAIDDAVSACISLMHDKYPSYIHKIENIFPTCPICGKRLNRNNSVHTDEDGNICNECFHKIYRQCARCGQPFKRDVHSREDLCPNCSKREWILPYHRHYPDIKFFGDAHENTQPFLGIELEVDEGGHSDDHAAVAVRTMNKNGMFVYCSHDSSLEEGFEIITQPATLEYHTSIKGIYGELFDKLKHMKYCSHDTVTCGLHVHFNRNFFADNEEIYITRLLYLVEKFWDNIVIFSRRNERRLTHFAKKMDEPARNYYSDKNKSGRHEDHYYSLNISNENTIEFRMYRGTLNIETFFDTLQFTNNCIVTAKNKTTEEIQQMKFEDLIDTKELKKYWKRRTESAFPNEE